MIRRVLMWLSRACPSDKRHDEGAEREVTYAEWGSGYQPPHSAEGPKNPPRHRSPPER
jgi:hypothetical protein